MEEAVFVRNVFSGFEWDFQLQEVSCRKDTSRSDPNSSSKKWMFLDLHFWP